MPDYYFLIQLRFRFNAKFCWVNWMNQKTLKMYSPFSSPLPLFIVVGGKEKGQYISVVFVINR